ncbi:MAG: tyrosine-type recombinase/integrase, partial [Planctomycetota bacterium]
ERFSIIGPKAEEALRFYLEQRPHKNASSSTETENPLWVSRFGKKVSEQTIRKILKQYLSAIGIDFHYTPHSIRNSFANHLLKHGAHPRIVQELMGYAHLSTTQVHLVKRNEKLRNVYERSHPHAQWNPPLPFKEEEKKE